MVEYYYGMCLQKKARARAHVHAPFSEGTCQSNIPFSNFLIFHHTEKLCTNIWGSSKF